MPILKKASQLPTGYILCLVGIISIISGLLISLCSLFMILQFFDLSPQLLWQTFQKNTLMQTNGRTNVLVLGIGGGSHESPDLTDTIQIFSISTNAFKPIMVSIPRDLWSETLQDRINTAYYYGIVQERNGGGIGFAKEIVQEITGVPIHYAVVVDFSAFQKVIDVLGGVEIDVQEPFTDNQFPIVGKENDLCNGDPLYGCRYMSVTFQKGIQTMSGERALMYVRSRHAEGDEGTDFARARRQQEVIEAMINTIKQPRVWLRSTIIPDMLNIVNTYVVTDIQKVDILQFMKILFTHLPSVVPDRVSLESQLLHPPNALYGGRYVLIPVMSYQSLRDYIEASLSATTNRF